MYTLPEIEEEVKELMIGRKEELETLYLARDADESGFIAVYGRRRVGKTYLVRKAFDGDFAFYHTGIANVGKKEQLARFVRSLQKYGLAEKVRPKDWFEAFDLLSVGLEKLPPGKKVVFIDELPWMDTPKSNFVSALENFWNGWASAREDMLLIVCGSASSWILSKIVDNHGGLHNRLTDRIHLKPFNLAECEALAQERGLAMPRAHVLEAYMIFGGVPYYWTLLKSSLGLAQNVDRLCFCEGGALADEFAQLYASLFRRPLGHIAVVTALSTKKIGMTREEVIAATGAEDSGALTKVLKELEACGFVRKYRIPGCKAKGAIYQLIDNFTLFYFKFLQGDVERPRDFWSTLHMSQEVRIWRGLAFERVCLEHVDSIRRTLGIAGVRSRVYAFGFEADLADGHPGGQIDLVIDRDDDVINLCEMKCLGGEYVIDEAERRKLENRREAFLRKTRTSKAVHLTIVSANGTKRNVYAQNLQGALPAESLF